MKIPSTVKIVTAILITTFGRSFQAVAQTSQYVTLAVSPGNPSESYALATNQIVQIESLAGSYSSGPPGSSLLSYITLYHSTGVTAETTNPGIYSGLTSVSLNWDGGNPAGGALATFKITTPGCSTVVSNYVPADAIVIPSSATGNVQIILQSSPDLVNWTAAEPGIYGASAGTNRFFRVVAQVQ